MGNGRDHRSHDNGHSRGNRQRRRRSRSRSSSRSQSQSRSPYHRHSPRRHRRSPDAYDRHSPTRYRESAPRGKRRSELHVSPSRSRKSLSRYSGGYEGRNRESGQVGSPEKIRRYDSYDSDRGGRSSPTYLPYSVPDHDHPATQDHDRVDYDSDEKDLENLSPHEYRMVKRERMRKRMVACIWRATPSPPHGDDTIVRYAENYGSHKKRHASDDEDNEDDQRDNGNKSPLRREKVSASPSSSFERDAKDSTSNQPDRKKNCRSHKKRQISLLSRKKQRSSLSDRKKNGRSHKKRHASISDDEYNEDDERDNGNKSPLRREKVSASPSSSFERGSKDSSSNQSDGETDKDDDTAVEIDEEAMKFKVLLDAQKKSASALENEPIVGPAPAPKAEGHISYGGALRPGEGDAIAQYVQQGKRIPRRGEVGLSAEEIQKYEGLGYVMSGSRHQRMNAIRIRKENQVYSAEDKRALAMFNYEEKAKREHQVMSDLQRLIQRHIGQDPGPTHDPFATKQPDPPPDT